MEEEERMLAEETMEVEEEKWSRSCCNVHYSAIHVCFAVARLVARLDTRLDTRYKDVPHCGKEVSVLLDHGVDSTSHQKLGIKPVLLGHVQVPGVHKGRPSAQDLHHQLASTHREEEARPATAEGMAAEEVGVEASLLEGQLQQAGKLLVVDVLVPAVREGWGIGWSRDPLVEQRHVPV